MKMKVNFLKNIGVIYNIFYQNQKYNENES